MDTRHTCPSCHATCKVPTALRGKEVRCPRCNKKMTTPDVPVLEEVVEDPPRRRRRLKKADRVADTLARLLFSAIGALVIGGAVIFGLIRWMGNQADKRNEQQLRDNQERFERESIEIEQKWKLRQLELEKP
jgi:hypothetical protein